MLTLPVDDLEHVLAGTVGLWESLRGKRLFVTGGTGFFGCWLLESFVEANRRYDLRAEVWVLSRDPGAFAQKAPALASCAEIRWVRGSISELTPDLIFRQLGPTATGPFAAVIHLATEADLVATAEKPLAALQTIVEGTRRALDFAVAVEARRFIFTSSGAVYGRQPSDLQKIPENFRGGPDFLDFGSAYGVGGEAKRYAELLCAAYSRERKIETVMARGFAFVGPYLPLNAKFAVGNFLDDALHGREIVIKGDGTPLRSYLYAADLAVWLWTLLFRGAAGQAYNVGSEKEISIRECAEVVDRVLAGCGKVTVAREAPIGSLPERYLPSTRRAREELGLSEQVSLEEAIRRTAAWHRTRAKR